MFKAIVFRRVFQSLQPFTYLFRTKVQTACVFFVLFPYLRNSIVAIVTFIKMGGAGVL